MRFVAGTVVAVAKDVVGQAMTGAPIAAVNWMSDSAWMAVMKAKKFVLSCFTISSNSFVLKQTF